MSKILLISRCPPYPLFLGDRLILYHLGDELEGRRHQIDLLAFASRPEDWQEQDAYDMAYESVELIQEPHRTQVDYLRRSLLPRNRWPKTAAESWSPEMWRAIERRVAETEYDAVHLFGGIQVYEFFHALRGLPAIITPYESYSLYLRRVVARQQGTGRLAAVLQQRLAQHFESWMFTPYDRVTVVSLQDRDELLANNPGLRVDVIPNGIDLYYFRARPVQRLPSTLLFVGNYEYTPNVDAALYLAGEIFPQIETRFPEARLWLVGNAPPPELLALNRPPAIKVTGRVPDVRPYLARATAFVCPLRFGAGIKNKVLEALAMACPVVATPLSVDGITVENGKNALICPETEMVNTIADLLHQPDLQRQLSSNGPGLIREEYSWGRVAEMYEALYQAVQK